MTGSIIGSSFSFQKFFSELAKVEHIENEIGHETGRGHLWSCVDIAVGVLVASYWILGMLVGCLWGAGRILVVCSMDLAQPLTISFGHL